MATDSKQTDQEYLFIPVGIALVQLVVSSTVGILPYFTVLFVVLRLQSRVARNACLSPLTVHSPYGSSYLPCILYGLLLLLSTL